MHGGAGTGKTWIAMKMAKYAAEVSGKEVLFVCASKPLAEMVRVHKGEAVEVKAVRSLFQNVIQDFDTLNDPTFERLSNNFIADRSKYGAIFVDEAQDFTSEWASIVRKLLVDDKKSRLGIFFDDVLVLREDCIGDGFGIQDEPFLLRENIRITAY